MLRVIIVAALVVMSATAIQAQQLPDIPGVTRPLIPQPNQGQPYPQGQPYQGQPYRGDQYQGQQYRGDYRGNPGYSDCSQLASREQSIRDDLANMPPSGRDHDRAVYQLGQIRNEQRQRCR